MRQARRGGRIAILGATSATREAVAQGPPASDNGSSIIYVDRCALTRDCIGSQLASALPEFRLAVLASPSDADRVEQPGCIVYNTHSFSIEDAPVVRDLALLQDIANGVPVVVLSDVEAPENVIGALHRGVAGYLPTSLSLKLASEAIRLVLFGGTFVPASALPLTMRPEPLRSAGAGDGAPGSAHLTPRQVEVLRHLWQGKQNKTIALELRMSEGTVKVHIKHIMKKLHAHNRTQVVLMTQRMLGGSEPLDGQATSVMERQLAAPSKASTRL
jgi:DNA-binding NarL/FixJ family response regulator